MTGVNLFTNLFEWRDIAERAVNFIQSANPYIVELLLFAILVIGLIVLIFGFYRRKIKVADIEDVVVPRINILTKHDEIIINFYSKLSKGVDVTDKSREIRKKPKNIVSRPRSECSAF